MSAKYRKKTCRECGGVYYRRFRRNAGTDGWCRPRCYAKEYYRRRKERGEAQERAPGE